MYFLCWNKIPIPTLKMFLFAIVQIFNDDNTPTGVHKQPCKHTEKTPSA